MAQYLTVEELVVINKKNETQFSGLFTRFNWKHHTTMNYYKEGKSQTIFSKKMSESPLSLEFIKYNYLYDLYDSYLELVVLDSVRIMNLRQEVIHKFKAHEEILPIHEDSVDVYIHPEYIFIFSEKYSERHKLKRYHLFIYNSATYHTLKRKKEYLEFWSE